MISEAQEIRHASDYDVFYIDTDNLSLKNAESFIEKEICILRGYLGILENIK